MLNSVGAAGKVFEYLDRKPQVSTEGKLEPDQLKGHVSLRRLSFAYPAYPNKTVLQVRSARQAYRRERGFSSDTKILQMNAFIYSVHVWLSKG